MVSYQSPSNPSDTEWTSYVQAVERLYGAPHPHRYLVLSEGGHPSRAQQAQLTTATKGRTSAVSIVSSSLLLRFVGAMMGLFNPRVQCFGPEQMERAFSHIDVGPADEPKVLACLAALRAELASRAEAA
jgi:hypothetical protein